MLNLTMRNFKLFFRDRGSVFFSLLSAIIILALYIFVLGDSMVSDLDGISGAKNIMDNWIMAGLLAATSITAAMGAYGIMINDKERKTTKDFLSSPIKRYTVYGSYILNAILVSLIICVITFILAQIYIVGINHGEMLSLVDMFKVIGILALGVFCSSSIACFLSSFAKTNSAFSGMSIVLGTVIGFITGIYIPVGALGEGMQLIVKAFPVSHAGALLRKVMMNSSLNSSFSGIGEAYLQTFKEEMGVVFMFNGNEMTTLMHIGILVISGILFYILAVMNLSRKAK